MKSVITGTSSVPPKPSEIYPCLKYVGMNPNGKPHLVVWFQKPKTGIAVSTNQFGIFSDSWFEENFAYLPKEFTVELSNHE
jgi:hypothetical protein